MKKTLVIAPKHPLLANDGSSMRTMNFVRYFKEHGEVDILCQRNGSHIGEDYGDNFTREYLFDNEGSKANCFERAVDKLVRLKSWSTSHYTKENEQAIRAILMQGNYDFILCRYASQAYPLLNLNSQALKRVILDVDDLVTETIYDAEAETLTGIGRLSKVIDKQVLKMYYKKCMCFGSILFCSDADMMKTAGPAILAKAHVVPNVYQGMTLPDGYASNGYDKANRLLFVGSLKYSPNAQGISWFINQLFPRALERFNDLTLTVVGRNPPDELASLVSRYSQIELQANVPDVAPFYERCGISVVPLLAGGGTRIKILESGLAKRPVMSTEIGAYGLGMGDGKEVMIFGDSKSFLDKYRRMREDEKLYGSMTDNLSRFVQDNFSFDNFRQSMDAVIKRLIDRQQRVGGHWK